MTARAILTGWKAIIECARACGAPTSERHLRRLGAEGIPIFRPKGRRGGVVRANEERLKLWFETRYVHIGAEQIGEPRQKKAQKSRGRSMSDRVRRRPNATTKRRNTKR